jgi:hypothetical protein
MASGLHGVAAIQNQAQAGYVLAHIPVPPQPGAGSIGSHHAPDGTLGTAGGVWGQTAAVLGQTQVQVAKDDPWLDANAIAADFDDLAEKTAEVDDKTLSQSFSSQAAACAPRHQGNTIGSRVLHQGLDIFFVARHDDAERFDLEDTGVGTVQTARHVIEKDFPSDEPVQIVANVLALRLVHDPTLPTR